MKRFVFHRLLSFWLGLAGMLFLLWAWWTTLHENVQITRSYQVYYRGHMILKSLEGVWSEPGGFRLYVTRMNPPPGMVLRKGAVDFYRGPFTQPVSASWFLMPERFYRDEGWTPEIGGTPWSVVIPIWMIAGPYFVGWTLLLAWRLRKGRKGRKGMMAEAG